MEITRISGYTVDGKTFKTKKEATKHIIAHELLEVFVNEFKAFLGPDVTGRSKDQELKVAITRFLDATGTIKKKYSPNRKGKSNGKS
jgi:hypothetical protein